MMTALPLLDVKQLNNKQRQDHAEQTEEHRQLTPRKVNLLSSLGTLAGRKEPD